MTDALSEMRDEGRRLFRRTWRGMDCKIDDMIYAPVGQLQDLSGDVATAHLTRYGDAFFGPDAESQSTDSERLGRSGSQVSEFLFELAEDLESKAEFFDAITGRTDDLRKLRALADGNRDVEPWQ